MQIHLTIRISTEPLEPSRLARMLVPLLRDTQIPESTPHGEHGGGTCRQPDGLFTMSYDPTPKPISP